MSTVQDLILERLNSIEGICKDLGEDMAVLKSQHNTGNKSEKIAAWSSITAVVISIVSIATACGALSGESKRENPFEYRLLDRDNSRLQRNLQPKKDDLSDDGDNP